MITKRLSRLAILPLYWLRTYRVFIKHNDNYTSFICASFLAAQFIMED